MDNTTEKLLKSIQSYSTLTNAINLKLNIKPNILSDDEIQDKIKDACIQSIEDIQELAISCNIIL